MFQKKKKYSNRLFFILIFYLFFMPVLAQENETEESLHSKKFKAAYPNTSIDYRGIVVMDTDSIGGDELIGDFGGLGIWVYHGGVWTQITNVDPNWIFSFQYGGTNYLLVDFGAGVGLWHWHYNGSWSGPWAWKRISEADASFAFAVDDDGDGGDEVHVDFNTLGLWRFDIGNASPWIKLNSLSPSSKSFKSDVKVAGIEEGVHDFGSSFGLWMVWGSPAVWLKINSLSPGDDNVSANVMGGSSEDLILDFGTLGMWLYDGYSWYKLAGSDLFDIKEVKFSGSAGYELLCYFGSIAGLWMWDYSGYPGIWTRLTSSLPDWDGGFCEPFDSDGDGFEEVVVDFGSLGLWKYNHAGVSWTKLHSSNPEFMVRADYFGYGYDACLVVDFGDPIGLWLYNGKNGTWTKLTTYSPDGVI